MVEPIRTSPAMTTALEVWQAARIALIAACEISDEESNRTAQLEGLAYRALMALPSVNAADFIAKTYVDLLGELGSLHRSYDEAARRLSMFDLDISDNNDPRDQHDLWVRTFYADLDACDMGANLLAYGLPYFSASRWLQRAEAIGLNVHVIVQGEGKAQTTSYGIELPGGDVVDPHIDREQGRLQRIFAADPGRGSLLVAEIRKNWPHLITTVPSCQAAA
jgi:hypothetical protein